MAKRERDGWKIARNLVYEFKLEHEFGHCAVCVALRGTVHVQVKGGIVALPPARASQFAEKVAAIAARAAKEAKA